MLNRTPYLIAFGILVLLSTSYWGYRAYQSHVEFEEFMSGVEAFERLIDRNDFPLERTLGITISETKGRMGKLFPDGQRAASLALKKPVKVRILPPEKVELYREVVPNGAIRLRNGPAPDLPTNRTWSSNEMVIQFLELPDGSVVEVASIPGDEILEGERLSPQFIENAKPVRDQSHIEMDGVRHDIPIESADDEYASLKRLWASTLDVSVLEIEQMIANRELVVKLSNESMTPEDTKINFNALRKIPRHIPFLRSTRPDLFKEESTSDKAHQSSERGIELDGPDFSSSPFPSSPSESEPVPQGKIEGQSPLPSESPEVLNQETQSGEQLPPERFDKARQLINRYGQAEGLRRLREMDPEAARQFERERKPPPAPDEPETQ